ncbi:uncharacterized protein G2W53_020648 [Senna tora]|uniref:Uncharacterized protein n=1 Tax=Senna tora TaxID=362788 RepID=A0A834TK06_9FABA|nr:uncharacterized protein G2W53_020648 [Senna tora]
MEAKQKWTKLEDFVVTASDPSNFEIG